MVSKTHLLQNSMLDLMFQYPYLSAFFEGQSMKFDLSGKRPLHQILADLDEAHAEDNAFEAAAFIDQLQEYINQMQAFMGEDQYKVETISLLPGHDKAGVAEKYDKIILRKSTITSIVGPTGSGKSRLLADIEWVARGDTPTGRTVLVNEGMPSTDWRFASGRKLVAQLSQNMNFVMDLQVREFVELHAKSRMIANEAEVVRTIIAAANELAGEKFLPETPITALSGGQSRALMIADTAILSSSPVVLIDEIENAGIDRKRALQLLVGEEKVVLMATHDPILALMADQRIVIKNGGILKVIQTSEEEKLMLGSLEEADRKLQLLRAQLRSGELLQTV